MSFQNKYLKYKSKYLDLKNQIGGSAKDSGGGGGGGAKDGRGGGGALSTLPPDVINNILESLTNEDIIHMCESEKSLPQSVSWSKLIRNREINIDRVLNLDGFEPTMCMHITVPTERASCRKFYNYTKYTKPFKTIACGNHHSMAVKNDGTVVAWGSNNYGESNVPKDLNNVVSIACSNSHSMALKRDGTVVAWGRNNYGQCNVPADLSNVVSIAAGTYHSIALKGDGTVVEWGVKYFGLGPLPTGLKNVVSIAAGTDYSIALKGDGTLVTWVHSKYKTIADELRNIVSIAGGDNHIVVLSSSSHIGAWGSNEKNQCDVPYDVSHRVFSADDDHRNNVVAIAAGDEHSMALKHDGTVVVWGGTSDDRRVPRDLNNVVAIDCGRKHSMALRNDGTIVEWGYDPHYRRTIPEGLIARLP